MTCSVCGRPIASLQLAVLLDGALLHVGCFPAALELAPGPFKTLELGGDISPDTAFDMGCAYQAHLLKPRG